MSIEKLNNEFKPSVEQEKVAKLEKEPTFEPMCGGCKKPLHRIGLNYKNKQIWRCENKKCGREGSGVVVEDEA